MDILDQILAAEMANEYTDSKQLASVETVEKVLTFDGDITGKPTLEIGSTFVKISDEHIPFKNFLEVSFTSTSEETNFNKTFRKEEMYYEGDDYVWFGGQTQEGNPAIASFSVDVEDIGAQKGTYVMCDATGAFVVSAIVRYMGETIHQIDPKFIPGYIPVIELENIMEVPASVAENLETATDHKAAGQLLMTEDEIAIATEAMRTDSPIVLKIKTRLPPDGDGVQTVVMNRVNNFLTWEFDVYQYAGWTHAGLVFMCLDDGFPKCVMQLFGCFTVTECRKYMLEQNA